MKDATRRYPAVSVLFDPYPDETLEALVVMPPGALDAVDGLLRLLPAWQQRAACADEDREMFFPPPGTQPYEARRICATCPVQAPCLDYAVEHDFIGVWAGTTRSERRRKAQTAA